jgi:hypothetical protein
MLAGRCVRRREQFGWCRGAATVASLQVGETRVHELDAAAHRRLDACPSNGANRVCVA